MSTRSQKRNGMFIVNCALSLIDNIEVRFRFRFDNNCAVSDVQVEDPDIVLRVFERNWPCHRAVLCQSNFFRTLFNGSFRESKLKEIELHTDDQLINETSFQKLLDAMYHRRMNFAPDDIFNVTVTAQYFQMDDIVDFCETKITDMIKPSNAIDFYHFADRYYLKRTKESVFDWMLLRMFPVKCWDQVSYLTIELTERLIAHPKLVTPNEMYLYFVLKMLIQINVNGTCVQDNERFYAKVRSNPAPFLTTKDGVKFQKMFQALRLGNIIVRKENVELLIYDNIIPRSMIDAVVFQNWMSLVAIESPENFGPTSDIITTEEFESQAMRFAKLIHGPDFHSWKFVGFSFAFDLALFFDGRTLIIKRVHQINEHKVNHSHLLRRIMLRWDIAEMNSTEVERRQEIQTLTMTTNEEIILKQLPKELTYPCRISVEVMFHVPYKSTASDKLSTPSMDNEPIEHDDQSTGNLLRTSIKARAFNSYKRFFH